MVHMEYFQKKRVYKKVSRDDVENSDGKIIDTRWIVTNKGDEHNPNVRAMLVGRELKSREGQRLDLFAATPPLESLRLILGIAASEGGDAEIRVMHVDVSTAYFNTPVKREICIEIPCEDWSEQDGDVVGKLEKSLYGTRDAAQNWSEAAAAILENNTFAKGKANPCHFYSEEKSKMFHGDDYVAVGQKKSLKWLEECLRE